MRRRGDVAGRLNGVLVSGNNVDWSEVVWCDMASVFTTIAGLPVVFGGGEDSGVVSAGLVVTDARAPGAGREELVGLYDNTDGGRDDARWVGAPVVNVRGRVMAWLVGVDGLVAAVEIDRIVDGEDIGCSGGLMLTDDGMAVGALEVWG